ncbi:MAG: hypothetical protein B6U73_04315 [Desulfurococcales archaeon ex4484_204]|nr:MAG: hypothetical protein B6U73_04315 [Desulfurococcales archaeon ex4484_204]
MEWVTDVKLSRGVVDENTMHVLYTFYWYAGRVREVYAVTHRLRSDITVEGNVAVLVRHEGGGVSVLERSRTTSHRWRRRGVQVVNGTVACEGYLSGEYGISCMGKTLKEGVFSDL